jgi:hypothetical protein
MICQNCIHSEVCKHKRSAVYECEHFKDVTIKNQYDRIRDMSVKEMAQILHDANDDICFEVCSNGTGNKYCCPKGEGVSTEDCVLCIKKWLEREVDTE